MQGFARTATLALVAGLALSLTGPAGAAPTPASPAGDVTTSTAP